MNKRPLRILPVIIFSQFTGTGLWFASNAVMGDLQRTWGLGDSALGYMTSAVQLGFIVGTLVFAFFAISDRFSPRILFFVCSLLGALSNLCIFLLARGLASLLIVRFITGFLLAGIYPVGMKIAAGWYEKGLGRALGFLLGALVLGTAFSTLTAQTAPEQLVGLALTLVNCIGFLITIFSIQIANYVITLTGPKTVFLILIPGPMFGLIHLWPLFRKNPR